MEFDARSTVMAVWSGVGVLWLAAALRASRPVRIQPAASRIPHLALVLAAGVLLFSHWARQGWLDVRIVPDASAWRGTGLILTVVGTTIAVWARLVLGRNWSGRVTIKAQHRLVQNGPYRVVRHPIYSGLLLAGLGTALVFGRLAGFLAVALAVAGWWTKSRLEDRYLRAEFGEAYSAYSGRVKALIPFLL